MKVYLFILVLFFLSFKEHFSLKFDVIEKGPHARLVYYSKSEKIGKTPVAYCLSVGMQYVGEISPDSDHYVCAGNITVESLKYHSKGMIEPHVLKVSNAPVVRFNHVHEQSSFTGINSDMNTWHIPTISTQSTKDEMTEFHLNAYDLVNQGFTGKNATIVLVDSCFLIHNNDVHGLVDGENEKDSSNVIGTPMDGSDCTHGTEIWSLLTGRDLCTDGIIPEISVIARTIPILNNELTDIEFARSQHADRGQVIIRTFVPMGWNPATQTPVPFYDPADMPKFVRDVIHAGIKRGGSYFVSAGNYGNRYNSSSARTCFDATIAGEFGLFPIAASAPSGSAWYSNRGCIAFTAPGGDESSCISANNGEDCTCVAGTSFSCPLAGSLAAELQSLCSNELNAYDIYDILIKTSTASPSVDDRQGYQFYQNGANISYSDAYGFGLINFKEAISYVKKNNCPKMPQVTYCTSQRIVVESNVTSAFSFNLTAPSNCSIKNITYVQVNATFDTPLGKIKHWYISSPAKKIPCLMLPVMHPYTQSSLKLISGCRPFYGEKYEEGAAWNIRFVNAQDSYSRATFSFRFEGYID